MRLPERSRYPSIKQSMTRYRSLVRPNHEVQLAQSPHHRRFHADRPAHYNAGVTRERAPMCATSESTDEIGQHWLVAE